MARTMGAAFVYGTATLQHPKTQLLLERAGYNLIGFTPDREAVETDVVKYVFEAVYAKVLISEDALLRPDPKNMTPRAKSPYNLLFPV